MNRRILFSIATLALLSFLAGCTAPQVDTTKLAEKSRAILKDQVKNGSEKNRESIVKLTGGMTDEESIPLLETAMNDMQPKIVDKAMEKIIEKKNPATLKVIREKLGDKFDPKLIQILIDLKADDIDANIEKGLQSLRPNDRAFAVELLGKYKGKLAEDRLREYAKDPNELVRIKAKVALVRMGDADMRKEIGTYLDLVDAIETVAVLSLVEEMDLKEYRDKVLKIANEDTGLMGEEATRTLYKWDDPEGKSLVQGKLAKEITMNLYPILKMVEEKKDKDMIPALRRAMSSSTPNERYSAARVAVTIDPDNTKDVLTFILNGMDSDDPGVREQVAVALSQLPGIPEVKRVLERKGIKDSNSKVVHASLVALGKVGDKNTISYLAPFLDDVDSEKRSTAAAVILNIINRQSDKGSIPGATEDKESKDKTAETGK